MTGKLSSSKEIEVRVRFFAALKQAAGGSTLSWRMPQGSTVGDLVQALTVEYPGLPRMAGAIYAAVNRSYAGNEVVLQDRDEVALFPPVSGGRPEGAKLFEVTEQALSLDDVAARVAAVSSGAIALFAGVVRGETDVARLQPGVPVAGQVLLTDHLEYEAYAEMAELMLAEIGAEVQDRWPQVEAVAIVHRVGRLGVGEASVLIAVAAAHRQGVFDACSYAIERLKAVVPIWKKEVGSDGQWWVEGPRQPGSVVDSRP